MPAPIAGPLIAATTGIPSVSSVRSGAVARNSLHMSGKAADLRLKSRSVGQMYKAAMSCRAGGVGKYSRSNFVHMDCGPLRTWGG